MRKMIIGLAVTAVMLVSGVFTTGRVDAQYYYGGAYSNPVSQWIVLSGLFNPYGFYGTYGTYGYGGTGFRGAYYNPISQWIVLSGLFGY